MLIDNFSQWFPTNTATKKYWCNLKGSSTGLALAEALTEHRFIAIITEGTEEALALADQVHFFKPKAKISHFPDWETLPYDHFSPHQDIISSRLACLFRLLNQPEGLLFIPINTLMQRICPQSYLAQHHFVLHQNDQLVIETFTKQLQQKHYRRVATVYEHGEYAIRGGIIDLYPMGASSPYRIELFDDEVETIKTFDPETQRTQERLNAIEILPGKEFPLDQEGINQFKDNWYDHFEINIKETLFYDDLNEGFSFNGIEYYLPLFFDQTANLLDYLPQNTLVFSQDQVASKARQLWHDIVNRHEQYGIDARRPLLQPEHVFYKEDEINQKLNHFQRIVLTAEDFDDPNKGYLRFPTLAPTSLPIDQLSNEPFAQIVAFLQTTTKPILFCAETLGRKEVFYDLFSTIQVSAEEVIDFTDFIQSRPPIGLTVSPINQGLHLKDIEIIAESQLYGYKVRQQRKTRKTAQQPENIIKSLTELKLGAPVVHLDHGIGRYLGLKVIEVNNEKNEFLHLLYADEASLYVPVSSLHLISRYAGSEDIELVKLHRLGNEQWQKAKKKAAEKANDVAAELLDIYARRAARAGMAHEVYTTEYQRFANSFPFEETEDQQQAISKVLEDMAKPSPMDRLVCGDVGFGKTEVAMRAAFIAANSAQQVAILVPTTLLAQQHFESFRDRFAAYPINIEVLSRFKSQKQQNEAIKKLQSGQIDIIIGTHKLIQSSIKFKQLGLIIIDEEHRFGVKQKEMLKSMRSNVDVLAMTATPIPRTLNLSMAGIRDISIIATPPAKRLSINTFVQPKQDAIIKEAVLRELLRGGQVFYLYNEVKTIDNMAKELAELLPEARIGIGHGQMRERELESVMTDFYHKRYNILLCTTIIETGIDIPSANTIIIDRADKFGLAQLHQLRGRVGRSHHQAYAYLLTPNHKKITKDAEKRLEAISEASDLGAGFTLATHDLEIRGAGELLGDEQTGHIQSVGFSLYMEMLDKAVRSIQRGETPNIEAPLSEGTEIDINLSTIIPEDYLPDVHSRLIIYKRIANCINKDELKSLKIEMIDRFGLLPDSVKNLFEVTAIKLNAEVLGISKIIAGSQGGRIKFNVNTTIEPMELVSLIQKQPNLFKFDGAETLKFAHTSANAEQRINVIHAILSAFNKSP